MQKMMKKMGNASPVAVVAKVECHACRLAAVDRECLVAKLML